MRFVHDPSKHNEMFYRRLLDSPTEALRVRIQKQGYTVDRVDLLLNMVCRNGTNEVQFRPIAGYPFYTVNRSLLLSRPQPNINTARVDEWAIQMRDSIHAKELTGGVYPSVSSHLIFSVVLSRQPGKARLILCASTSEMDNNVINFSMKLEALPHCEFTWRARHIRSTGVCDMNFAVGGDWTVNPGALGNFDDHYHHTRCMGAFFHTYCKDYSTIEKLWASTSRTILINEMTKSRINNLDE